MNNVYRCDKCNINCKYKSHLENHIKTELHKTGKKKIRSDKNKIKKPKLCPDCKYQTNTYLKIKSHILTHHKTKEEKEKEDYEDVLELLHPILKEKIKQEFIDKGYLPHLKTKNPFELFFK